MSKPLPVLVMDDAALSELTLAHRLLENPGFAAQIANTVGAPIEHLVSKRLPGFVRRRIEDMTHRALSLSLKSALFTLSKHDKKPASSRTHKLAVALTGGTGGLFGLPGLAVELPVTTTLILRSIADIARAEGERLDDPEAALSCLEVLAHGGRHGKDDGSESGYFAVRTALAQQINVAARHLAAHGLNSHGASALIGLVGRVASRFSIRVSEKVAAQAVPLVGALSGATLNALFISHFQTMARGHFIVRRLERTYGAEAVRNAYEALSN